LKIRFWQLIDDIVKEEHYERNELLEVKQFEKIFNTC
jgi:hypothetical protein